MLEEKIRLKVRNNLIIPTMSKRWARELISDDFTIISNNCWAGTVYESYAIEKKTPTVGMFIMPEDYLLFLMDLNFYLNERLVFIEPFESKWKCSLSYKRNWGKYPIARLGNIELHMLHYHDKNIALDKWNRRIERINHAHLMVKFNDQNGCSKEILDKYLDLKYKNKIFFTSNANWANKPETIFIPQPRNNRNEIYASREPYGPNRLFNVTKYINNIIR